MAGARRSEDRGKEARASRSKREQKEDEMRLRWEAAEVLDIYRNGDLDMALDRAMSLFKKYNASPSPVIYNLLGDLNTKAFHSREAKGSPEMSLWIATDMYGSAAKAVPDCIEKTTAHGESLSASKEYSLAESKYKKALSIARPLDPATNNIAYGVSLPEKTSKSQRIAAARERLQRAIDINNNACCEDDVERVLSIAKSSGAVSAVHRAAAVATKFPNSARAQILPAYVALDLAKSIGPDVDKKEVLQCALKIMDSAANISDRSLVIALFRAGLMTVLHDYAAAEDECHRALIIEKADDPRSHEIPAGSTKGDGYDDRICSVKKQIHGLLQTRVLFARRDWSLVTSEMQRTILSVRLDVLCEYYSKINRSLSKILTDAHHFVSSNKSWILRKCPHSSCCGTSFDSTAMLWSHLCNSHFGSLGEKLLEVSDPNLCDDVMGEHCCSLDVIGVSKDSSQHDLFCFMNVEGAFGAFLLSPFTAKEVAHAVEMQREKQKEGNDFIKAIKKKLRNLPSDRSSNEFHVACKIIQEMCHKLLKCSCFDYREVVLPLARFHRWGELKKCISQGDITSRPNITNKDIDDIFMNGCCSPEWNACVEHDSKTDQLNKHTANLKLSCLDNLIAGEDKRSEVLVVNAKPSDLESVGVEGNGVKPSATLETKGGLLISTSFPSISYDNDSIIME